MNLHSRSSVPENMQDSTSHYSNTDASLSELELLRKEHEQLKSKLEWFESECHRLAKMIAGGNKKREKDTPPSSTPWLPFDS